MTTPVPPTPGDDTSASGRNDRTSGTSRESRPASASGRHRPAGASGERPPANSTTDADSTDMFQAIDISPRERTRKTAAVPARPRIGGAESDDASESQWLGRATNAAPKAVGASTFLPIESELEEVIEVSERLMHVIDGVTRDERDVVHNAILDFAARAQQYLATWRTTPPRNEAERLARLATVPNTPAALDAAVDDLKLLATYLVRTRPEDVYDVGTWNLIRRVRRGMRSDVLRELAEVCHDLADAVADVPRHLLGPYLPRLEARWERAVRLRVAQLEPLLAIDATDAEPTALLTAMLRLEPIDAECRLLHALYPHPEWERLIALAATQRERCLPALRARVDDATKRVDLPAIELLLAALTMVPPETQTHAAVAPLIDSLRAARDAALAEVRAAAEAALSSSDLATIRRAIQRVQALPHLYREPGSEFAEYERRLQERFRELYAGLEAMVHSARVSDDVPHIKAALSLLEEFAEGFPDDSLVEQLPPLRAHLEALLAEFSRTRRLQAALDDLLAAVQAAMADADTPVERLDELAERVGTHPDLDDEHRGPLLDDLARRRQQLIDLQACVEAERSTTAAERLAAAEATMTPGDREVLSARVTTAGEHVRELQGIEARRAPLAEALADLAVEDDPAALAEALRDPVAAAAAFHAEPGAGQPGSVAPRRALADEVDTARARAQDFEALAALRAKTREAVGEPAKVAATETPAFAEGAKRVAGTLGAAATTLEACPKLRDTFRSVHTDLNDLRDAAGQWETEAAPLRAALAQRQARAEMADAGRALAARVEAAEPAVARLDAWLGYGSGLVEWHRRYLAALREGADAAEVQAAARAARAARRRKIAAVAAVVLLIAGLGIAGGMWAVEHQRQQRAEGLLARAIELRDEPSEDRTAMLASVRDSEEFLAEGVNADEFGERFDPVLDALRERASLVASLDAELAALRERLAAAERRIGETNPADSPFPTLTGEVVEFSTRALARQRAEVEELRLQSRLGHARLLARPGLEASEVPPVDVSLAAVRHETSVENDPPFEQRADRILVALEAHKAQLERDAALAALVRQGEDALRDDRLPGLIEFVAAGEPFVAEHGDPVRGTLSPLLDRARTRIAQLRVRGGRIAELLREARAALEAGTVEPLHDVHSRLAQAVADDVALPDQAAEVDVVHRDVGLAWLDAWIAQGLTSEDAAYIAETADRLPDIVAQLSPAARSDGEARKATARPRLSHRQRYFELRDTLTERVGAALQDVAPLPPTRQLHNELQASLDGLDGYDVSAERFGAEPSEATSLLAQVASLGRRVALLERAAAGLSLPTAEAVTVEAQAIREEVVADDGRPHEAALTAPLALLDALARLLRQVEQGLAASKLTAAEAAYESVRTALVADDAESLRDPLAEPMERLRAHIESLRDPYANVELTLDVPERTTADMIVATGTVRGADVESVYLYINGYRQQTSVRGGQFSTTIVIRGGNNTVAVSPTRDEEHPRAVRREVFSSAPRSAIQVTLTWNRNNTDLDLHVRQPNGEEIYYQNQNPGGVNGYLDVDDTEGFGPENYRFRLEPGQRLPPGRYVVDVVYFRGNVAVEYDVSFTWNANQPDEVVRRFSGTIRSANRARRHHVLSFIVTEDGELGEIIVPE